MTVEGVPAGVGCLKKRERLREIFFAGYSSKKMELSKYRQCS
jgi:hypothetical protein